MIAAIHTVWLHKLSIGQALISLKRPPRLTPDSLLPMGRQGLDLPNLLFTICGNAIERPKTSDLTSGLGRMLNA